MNGRLTPELDNFTFVSTRGLSVVDYVLTAHSTFSKCVYFKVDCVNDLLNELNLYSLLSPVCKPPDHSLLSFAFKVEKTNCSESKHSKAEVLYPKIRYNFSNTPDNFMNSIEWHNVIRNMISNIENNVHSEIELSKWYCKFCEVICSEMDNLSLSKDSSFSC